MSFCLFVCLFGISFALGWKDSEFYLSFFSLCSSAPDQPFRSFLSFFLSLVCVRHLTFNKKQYTVKGRVLA